MQTSMVIEGLLEHVKDTILREFTIIPTFVFDDSLDFRERAVQYLAREGVFQTLEGETPSEWALFIWTRSPIVTPSQVIRPHQVPYSNTMNDVLHGEFNHRLAQVDITCKIVSNSIEMSETMEEHMFVHGGERIDFVVDYGGVLGKIQCAAEAQASTNFEAEDLDGNGTVVAVSMDISLTYPVLIHQEEFANIANIPATFNPSGNKFGEKDDLAVD